MTDTTETTVLWIEDVRYEIQKIGGDGIRNRGVTVARYEGSNENVQQALLEIEHDGDTLRMVQVDGDLDLKHKIVVDQRYAPPRIRIWERIWREALG